MQNDFVIVGGGVAGFSAASRLSELRPGARIVLLESENRLPYKRTKLSKTLAVNFDDSEFSLEPEEWYKSRGIEVFPETRAVEILTAEHLAVLDDGRTVPYEKLLLATGARPMRADITPNAVQHVFWNRNEAEALVRLWRPLKEVTILGNGVLAVELADQAWAWGKRVKFITDRTQLLDRELTPTASKILAEALQRAGVFFYPKESLTARDETVVAVGSAPCVELAKRSGLKIGRGILVDDSLRTSIPDIWAAGDCAELPDGRISHLWHEAEACGKFAAESMLGGSKPLELPPFRLKTEVFGAYFFSMNKPSDPWEDIVEKEDGIRYQAFFFKDDRLFGMVMVNDKDRSKLYETAIRERWPRQKTLDTFTL